MWGSSVKYQKLQTNLRLGMNRLKLLEKKKTELAIKSRKEISEYLAAGKEDRARIRVEHIIREDYMVEALELIEMYCDLLLARMGLLQTSKELDQGLEEPIASIIWATPRLQAEVGELRVITEQLTAKYGKEFAHACTTNQLGNVSEKVMVKLAVQAPPRALIEKYLEEIARTYNVPFVPDAGVIAVDEVLAAEGMLIDLDKPRRGSSGGGRRGSGGSGGGGKHGARSPTTRSPQHQPYPQYQPQQPQAPYPTGYQSPPAAASYNPPGPPAGQYNPHGPPAGQYPELPDLPSVPNSSVAPPPSNVGGDSVNFDDLTRRFEELKKRK